MLYDKDDKIFLPTCIYYLKLKIFHILEIRQTDPQFPFIFLITKQMMNKTKPHEIHTIGEGFVFLLVRTKTVFRLKLVTLPYLVSLKYLLYATITSLGTVSVRGSLRSSASVCEIKVAGIKMGS